jgi:hypothetical protein
MSLKEAKKAAEDLLNSYGQNSFSSASTPSAVAAEIMEALKESLTDNWSFTVSVNFTTTDINTGQGEEQTTVTIIKDVQLTVDLSEVVTAGETGVTDEFDKTIDVEGKEYETDLTGDDLTSITALTTGTKEDQSALGVNFDSGVLGSRSGTIYVNKTDGVTGMTVKNGAFYFDLVYDPFHQAYLVETGTYNGNEESRYDELLGRYFVLSADKTNITVYELDESGSGGITYSTGESGTTYSLNGGYRVVNGGYLFVDDPAVTDANAGILYLVDRAVVVTPDGHVYPIAIEGHNDDGDISDETISFSAHMSQRIDTYSRPVYSVIQYQYRDPMDNQIKYFMSSGPGNSVYEEIYDKLAQAGYYYSNSLVAAVDYRTVGTVNGYEGYYYDTSSIPVYDLRTPKTNGAGQELYNVFNIFSGKYMTNPYTGTQEFTAAEANYYDDFYYQRNRIYRDIDGLNIVRPVDGGFTVTYTSPCSFSIPEDEKGHGIISKEKRVLLEDEGVFAAGTVLYLDSNKNIIALYTPDGEFCRYEQDTSYTPYIDDDQEIYTAYRAQGSGEALDLIADLLCRQPDHAP